jgi:hypothetical protein
VKAALLSLLALAAAGYVLIAAVMFFMQRNLLYVPGSKTFEALQSLALMALSQ